MKLHVLAGWFLLLMLAIASGFLSEAVSLGGKHPLEASALAIIIGIAVRNLGKIPELFRPGIASGDKLLIWGIVLLGASLDLSLIISQGPKLLAVIVAIMLLSLVLIFGMGRFFKLPENLSLLLAVGTTICGTTAIAIVAPLIRAKQEETGYSVATIALFGLIAVLVYPPLAEYFQVSDFAFGFFAGTAIHSTPQVVGAGFMFSDEAGQTATAIKLVRNCFIAPLAIAIAVVWSRRGSEKKSPSNIAKAFPWFLFGYFVMAWLGSQGLFSKETTELFSSAGKFLILMAMAGIGLSTDLKAFSVVGLKPLLVGLLGTILLAGVSVLSYRFFL